MVVWSQDWQLLMLAKYCQSQLNILTIKMRDLQRKSGIVPVGGATSVPIVNVKNEDEAIAGSAPIGGSSTLDASTQLNPPEPAASVKVRASTRLVDLEELSVKFGIFIHVPWPGSDMVKSLPVRNELLRGMLAFDLIGFQIFDYARHFLI